MKMKFTALFISLMIVITAFCGCGNSNSSDTSEKMSNAINNISESTETPSGSTETIPTFNDDLSLIGHWEYEIHNKFDEEKVDKCWYDFRSDGTYEYRLGSASAVYNYFVDSDGTLVLKDNRSLKRTTIDEFLKLDPNEARRYYAFDSTSAYFEGQKWEFKRK